MALDTSLGVLVASVSEEWHTGDRRWLSDNAGVVALTSRFTGFQSAEYVYCNFKSRAVKNGIGLARNATCTDSLLWIEADLQRGTFAGEDFRLYTIQVFGCADAEIASEQAALHRRQRQSAARASQVGPCQHFCLLLVGCSCPKFFLDQG